MFCTNLKEVKRMSEYFIKAYGYVALKKDYETTKKNFKTLKV